MMTVINAYRATGIWTMNSNISTNADCAPAQTTDNPEPARVSSTDNAVLQGDIGVAPGEKAPPRQSTSTRQPSLQPGCSWMADSPLSFATTPEQIMPLPKVNRTNKCH